MGRVVGWFGGGMELVALHEEMVLPGGGLGGG